MMTTLINAAVFNALWLVVLTQPLLIALVVLAITLAVHFMLIAKTAPAGAVMREVAWLAGVTALGWLIESLVIGFGVLKAEPDTFIALGQVPLWLLLLWLGFATLFRFGFVHLWRFKPALPLFGALAFLSYLAGANLKEGIELAQPITQSLFVIALYWACLLPGLIALYRTKVLSC